MGGLRGGRVVDGVVVPGFILESAGQLQRPRTAVAEEPEDDDGDDDDDIADHMMIIWWSYHMMICSYDDLIIWWYDDRSRLKRSGGTALLFHCDNLLWIKTDWLKAISGRWGS